MIGQTYAGETQRMQQAALASAAINIMGNATSVLHAHCVLVCVLQHSHTTLLVNTIKMYTSYEVAHNLI